jgi:hypothetical protein
MGACANASSVLVPAIVPDQKKKQLKENWRSGFPSARLLTNGLGGGANDILCSRLALGMLID